MTIIILPPYRELFLRSLYGGILYSEMNDNVFLLRFKPCCVFKFRCGHVCFFRRRGNILQNKSSESIIFRSEHILEALMNTNQKYKIIDRDLLKFIAVIPMAIGHFVDFYFGTSASLHNSLVLFLIAQASMIAPPIFFFFITEGFRHTHSLKKYAVRLLIFAIITQIPYCLMINGTIMTTAMFTYLNVFFTLFLGLIALAVSESNMKLWLKILIIILLDAVTALLNIQWLIFGIPIILILYHFRDRPAKRFWLFSLCCAGSLLMTTIPAALIFYRKGLTELFTCSLVGAAIDLCFLIIGYFIAVLFYNGEKGRYPVFSKWFFYIFYPAHLFIIYIAKLIAGK